MPKSAAANGTSRFDLIPIHQIRALRFVRQGRSTSSLPDLLQFGQRDPFVVTLDHLERYVRGLAPAADREVRIARLGEVGDRGFG